MHAHTHMRAHLCTHTCTRTHARTHAHTHARTHRFTHARTYSRSLMIRDGAMRVGARPLGCGAIVPFKRAAAASPSVGASVSSCLAFGTAASSAARPSLVCACTYVRTHAHTYVCVNVCKGTEIFIGYRGVWHLYHAGLACYHVSQNTDCDPLGVG